MVKKKLWVCCGTGKDGGKGDAASLLHMMNANTFTCGAFHVKKSDDVSAFGEEENMNTFKEKLLAAYGTAKVVYEEAIE